MKDKLALVIAALMITSMAFAISTTTVSATHTRTASIDDNTVKGDTPMVRIITIANDGPDAINRVEIIVLSGWGIAPTMKILKDNEVRLGDMEAGGPDNNVVTLPAGTLVELPTLANLTAPENTPVIIVKGTTIRWQPVGVDVDAALLENLEAKMQDIGGIALTSTAAENFELAEDIEELDLGIAAEGLLVRLVADTLVIRGEGDVVKLPTDTLVQLVGEATFELAINENITTTGEVDISGDVDNTKLFVATAGATTNTIYKVEPGDENIKVLTGTVVIPPGAELTVDTSTAGVKLFDNTEVIRGANENVTMEATTVAENQPKNWDQASGSSTLPPGENAVWAGIDENQIASGASLDFPFAFTSPGTGEYTIYVKTKDTKGVVVQTEITLTTDNTPPTVEITVSPEWAKASTKVTITVTASEPLAKLDNVMVAENAATENTQVTMAPNADNTVWTGTYTTENEDYEDDGTAMIYVIGEQYEDLIGNAGSGVDNATFTVDRLAPTTPDLLVITGFPESPTTTATWFIENEAMDNLLGNLVPLEGGTVKIRVGTTVYDVTPATSGYYSKSITLTDGTQEVGIQYIDRAGNVGDENAENITLDKTAPSITWGTIAGKALVDGVQINTKAPKITLTISDAGLGVDNWAFAVDNTGYSVQLRYDNDTPIENLVNALAHDNNVLEFENTISEQIDNTYYIYVVAGDSQLMDNDLIKFVIDTEAPDAPSIDAAYVITSTMDEPKVVKSTSRTIAGTAEAGATITVYGTVDTTETVLATTTAGSRWVVTFTLTAGLNTKIEISATDEAGNEGSRTPYGWMLADDRVPTVTLAELPETTDKTSITISGIVTKDDWEEWSDITLTVQVGTGRVEVPIGAGGSYSYSLELAEGSNTIVVQATDEIGNASVAAHAVVERTVTPWAIYAIILVIVALVLAAIAIFREPIFGRKR